MRGRWICLQSQFLGYATVVNLNRTKSFLFDLKCTKIAGGWGSAPDPAGGAYSPSPDPLAVTGGGEGTFAILPPTSTSWLRHWRHERKRSCLNESCARFGRTSARNRAHDMPDDASVNLASVSLASLRHRVASPLVTLLAVVNRPIFIRESRTWNSARLPEMTWTVDLFILPLLHLGLNKTIPSWVSESARRESERVWERASEWLSEWSSERMTRANEWTSKTSERTNEPRAI